MTREEAIDVYNGLINTKIKEAFEFFAPELRKINEEEIRKDIIGGLMWQRDNLKSEGPHDNNLILPGFCLTVGKHLSYLEKQKEHKPAVTHGETYHVDTLGTQQVIAGKMPQKPELVQQPPITYTYKSNASRDERLKAALLALLNSDLLKVKEGGYFTKQDLIEWVERIPTDKPAEWSENEERMFEKIDGSLIGLKTYVNEHPSMSQAYKESVIKDIEQQQDWLKSIRPPFKPSEEDIKMLEHIIGQYETGNKNSKVMGYLPRVEELSFLKKVLSKWKALRKLADIRMTDVKSLGAEHLKK